MHGAPPNAADATSQSAQLRACPSVASAAEWDGFAQRCGASFRCSHRGSAAWQFEFHRLHRLRRLELFLVGRDRTEKIGQCAVGVGRRHSLFSDGLHLLPEHELRWSAAMAAVLRHLGPAAYIYGSEWSVEPPREAELRQLPGATVTGLQSFSVDVVDFSRWDSWEGYLRAVSSNARRNVKKAVQAYPALAVLDGVGPLSARRYAESVVLRRQLFQRKGVARSAVGMVVRSLARQLSLRRYSHAAYLVDGRRLLAYYSGIAFGRNHYYLEGAARPGEPGTSWYLLLEMIRRAFDATGGQGKFVMGSDDGTQAGDKQWEGLRRSRQQCCATKFPTSVVRFTYDGPTVAR
jgi:hypothetical protein